MNYEDKNNKLLMSLFSSLSIKLNLLGTKVKTCGKVRQNCGMKLFIPQFTCKRANMAFENKKLIKVNLSLLSTIKQDYRSQLSWT